VQVLVLGPLEVRDDDGAVVPLSGARIRALTALLALEAGRVVCTDRLIDSLYGDEQPQRAGNALQLHVSRLRRAVKPSGAIVTRPPGYLLDLGPDDVDALQLERLVAQGRALLEAGAPGGASPLLRQALALWRGEALADFSFEEFAAGERARLGELRLAVTEDAIEADLALGRHAECAEALRSLVEAHPLRERFWGQLMVALYRSERQAEALRAFQQARTILAEELGIEPGPELRRLESAILAQDPSLAGSSRVAIPSLTAGNLARPLTRCIGRDVERRAIHGLLASHRLVTLIGPGGTGKTRLAVEVGLTGADAAQESVWMVDLAGVSAGQGVLPAVRNALGLQAPSMGTLADASSAADLAATLGERTALLVLDNCEHVIEEAAHAAADLVAACPRVRVLATSRECLGVPGEVLYAVPPLPLDHAAELFAERATASAPGLTLDDGPSIDAIADICLRLDGLPLAIELAAARVRALDVVQIAARLHDRFRLLSSGARTLLPRQRTLRAVVDWSYDLLEPAEQLLFGRLSVFANPAPLDAIEAVCGGAGIEVDDLSQLVSRLVDKSLVIVTPGAGGNRFSMLQTLDEYAGERLAAGGDGDAVRGQHAAWALALARGAERGAGVAPTVSLSELDAEVDNLDAALAWARDHEPALAVELAARLGWFWFWTGRIDLGWQALAGCLDHEVDGVPPALRTRAAAWGGMLGTVMQASGAAALVEAAVALGRSCAHAPSLGQALGIRAALTILRGLPEQATGDLDEATACYASCGDLHGQGTISMIQGLAAVAEGRWADAALHYERSVSYLDAAGDEWAAGVSAQRLAELAERRRAGAGAPPAADIPRDFSQALIRAQLASARAGRRPSSAAGVTDALALAVADHIRGRVTLRQNRPEEARSDLELALSRYRAQGHVAAVSSCLSDLGRIATAVGDPSSAVRLHAEATEAAMGATDGAVVLSALEGLSAALLATGDGRRAGLALGAADVLREAGARPWDTGADDRSPTEAGAAALLGHAVLCGVRASGRTMAIEDLLRPLVA
jgi:predicted ATPase/DNA-binding SARP family transcriptional activator